VSHVHHTNPATFYILSSEHLSALSFVMVFNWIALQEMEHNTTQHKSSNIWV